MLVAFEDAEFRAVCRGLSTRVLLGCGAAGVVIAVRDGLPTLEANGAADISIIAPEGVWQGVLAAVPPPGHQSFTALQLANPDAEVSGDPLAIAQARAALERLLEVLRGPAEAPTPAVRDLRRIAGRYETLRAPDGTYDVYVEEAGVGLPVVLLHTAGADGRQFQAQLADPAFDRFRLIAFDCPFHGRSMPPLDWDGGTYLLSQARYLGWVTSFIEQHAEGRAILVGCSMGAAMAVVAAAARPDLLRGVVALEPPLRSPGRRNPYLAHAAVAAGVHNAAYVRGLMSPTSPEAMRRRAGWIYSQGAPGVYTGDLAFYSDEFDGSAVGPRIDGCPVHLLCGEYDYSATPADAMALSRLIAGSTYVPMPGLGHFPMTEDPDRFRPYFLRALEAISG
jgi:pimeloyl-ACP methyl ester carboxylesterase